MPESASSSHSRKKQKILAVASSGGHWAELLSLSPVFDECDVVYVSTQKNSVGTPRRQYCVVDGNQWTKLRIVWMMAQIFFIVLIERPDLIISTGAAPGYFALRFGKMFGARTLWLESIANAEELSLSTVLVKPYADVLLTQWPHMAKAGGPLYKGSIL